MSTPLFLLLGLTIATCVIAYWADNLGKKLGKKRVTLLGLRPRQTATLMTMLSSVVIMLFTFVVLLVVNGSLRDALLRYDEEKAANRQLRADNHKLLDEQTQLKAQSEQARQSATQARQQAARDRQAAGTARSDYAHAREDLKKERTYLIAAQRQKATAQRDAREARQRAQEANRRLGEAKRQLEQVGHELKTARDRLAQLKEELNKARAAEREAKAKAKIARADETRARENALEQARKNLKETKAQLQEIERLEHRQTTLQEEIGRLEVVKNQLGLFDPRVDVPYLTVFAVRTIPGRISATQAAEQLREILAEGTRALKRDNPKRTLHLVLSDGSTRLPPDEIISLLADYLSTFKVPVSVRLTTTRHHAEAETDIQMALVPVPSRLAFTRGEVIASATINGLQSDARIFNQLLQLAQHGEDAARDRNVQPLLPPGEPFFASDTNERVFEALRRIQAAGGTVTVRLVADADITTLDQPRVRFEIAKSES